MRKSTKQKIVVIFLIVIFGMSSIAFVVSGIFGHGTQQSFQPLKSFVVEGEIDDFTKSVYVQNGFTFLEVTYADGQLSGYVDSLPERFVTPSGQTQLIVQKTPGGRDSARIVNFNANVAVNPPTPVNIEEALCRTLVVTPVECAFLVQNDTNATA